MKKSQLLIAALLAAGAASAQAAGPWYVDVHAGQSEADLPTISGLTLDKTDNTYSLNIGYRLNEMFSIEGGWTDLGEASYKNSAAVSGSGTVYGRAITLTNVVLTEKASVEGWTLGIAADIPVNKTIDFTARAGFFNWDGKHNIALTSGSITYAGTTYSSGTVDLGKFDGSDLYWGVGAAYKISDAVRAGLNFTRYTIDDTDVDTWTANLRYAF